MVSNVLTVKRNQNQEVDYFEYKEKNSVKEKR